jgi:hypothetical protein
MSVTQVAQLTFIVSDLSYLTCEDEDNAKDWTVSMLQRKISKVIRSCSHLVLVNQDELALGFIILHRTLII